VGLILLTRPKSEPAVREAVIELATEHDVHLIPCSKDKKSLVSWKSYQRRQPRESDLENWFSEFPKCYWGALTGRPFSVVDLDTHHDESVVDWAKQHLPFTPLTATTQNGGEHWFYSSMPNEVTVSAGAGVDVRSFGGYVIVAGNGYEWHWKDDDDFHVFADLPGLDRGHIKAIDSRRNRGTAGNGTEWRNTVLSWTARCVALGYSNERIMRECVRFTENGWTDSQTIADVKTMIDGARAKGWAPKRQDRPIELLSISDAFRLKEERPPEFLGDGFIFSGARIFVAGAPKIGKSQLVLEALTTAAVGGEWLGLKWNQPHKVLWLQAEIRGPYVASRILPLYSSFSEDERALIEQNFLWTERGDVDLMLNFERMQELFRRHQPTIIAIDPFQNYFAGEENSTSDLLPFLKMLNLLVDAGELGTENPPAVMLVDHTRKGARSDDGFDGIRGSGSKSGWFDSGILMTTDSSGAIRLQFSLRNGPRVDDRLVALHTSTMRFRPFGAENHPELTVRLLRALAQREEHWTTTHEMNAMIAESATELGLQIDKATAKKIRQEIYAHPHVDKDGDRRATRVRVQEKHRVNWSG
jgi:hypothetical protein